MAVKKINTRVSSETSSDARLNDASERTNETNEWNERKPCEQENQRLYDLRLTWQQGSMAGGKMVPNAEIGETSNVWHIE